MEALRQEVSKLHQNNIRLIMIGDQSRFDAALRERIDEAVAQTAGNTGLVLTIAANYGGRWDVLQAANRMQLAHPERAGQFGEEDLLPYLSMHYAPEPDLFIRTGGEQRISNFLLWQLAYSELYFTDTLWPDFDEAAFRLALQSYQRRERRFGRTSEQLAGTDHHA
jgi:undecaprenyl diphosphate synthase